MSKLCHQGIKVKSDGQGPMGFTWKGKYRPIRAVYTHWRIRTGWHSRETHRAYYRVETAEGGVYDIYRELTSGDWVLERAYD